MAQETIRTELRGRVAILWLDRPEKLNAWSYKMQAEMIEQIEAWNEDDGIGAIVLTGEGRAFCAGADIDEFNQRLDDDPNATAQGRSSGGSWPGAVRRSKPIVAAINGYAVGVGLTLVLPCDMRLAAEEAKLSIRFVRVGLVPELGSTRLLAQIAGLGHATDMCLSGRMVDAAEALRMGLVSAVVPKDDLLAAAVARADELANNPTPVVRIIKELLTGNQFEPDLDAVMQREGESDRAARRLPSHEEGIKAFIEKREPQFNQ